MDLRQSTRKPPASFCWVKNGGRKKNQNRTKHTNTTQKNEPRRECGIPAESRRKGNPNVLSLAIKRSFQRVYSCLETKQMKATCVSACRKAMSSTGNQETEPCSLSPELNSSPAPTPGLSARKAEEASRMGGSLSPMGPGGSPSLQRAGDQSRTCFAPSGLRAWKEEPHGPWVRGTEGRTAPRSVRSCKAWLWGHS